MPEHSRNENIVDLAISGNSASVGRHLRRRLQCCSCVPVSQDTKDCSSQLLVSSDPMTTMALKLYRIIDTYLSQFCTIASNFYFARMKC